jgi:hypothetical protein
MRSAGKKACPNAGDARGLEVLRQPDLFLQPSTGTPVLLGQLRHLRHGHALEHHAGAQPLSRAGLSEEDSLADAPLPQVPEELVRDVALPEQDNAPGTPRVRRIRHGREAPVPAREGFAQREAEDLTEDGRSMTS